ncbi:MAG: Pectate lyase, partial [uncultured bacterium]
TANYSDTGLTADVSYAYTVSAYDSAGNESVRSNTASAVAALPAFPGAEGFGALSIGGRGGRVIKVTNLNDSGPGSFREAVEAWPRHYATSGSSGPWIYETDEQYSARLENSGHRIVVFNVSGIINLASRLIISYPYITIAGQTSPGGILITGYPTDLNTHDAIVQHMRFRVGSHRIADGADPEVLDAFGVIGNAGGYYPNDGYKIIIDHCSFSWGVDETFSTAYNPKDVTIQWSIFSEALSHAGHPKGEHSKGVLIWGKGSPDTKVSFHHNYLAHNLDRNPLINNGNDDTFLDAVNNVIYNQYHGLGMSSAQNSRVNWIHNYAKPGPDTITTLGHAFYEVTHEGNVPVLPLIYVEGNLGIKRLTQSDPQWAVGNFWHEDLLSESYRRMTPWPSVAPTTQIMSYDVAKWIVNAVGATVPVRDSVDVRVVNDFFEGTGRIRDNVAFPADFPVFQNITPFQDTDNDGMPDSWESSQRLNFQLDDSALDEDSDGYTNIEEYLHYLSQNHDSNVICDLNLDSEVDVLDIQACVNHIIGSQSYGNADVNKDGGVDILDMQLILDAILHN